MPSEPQEEHRHMQLCADFSGPSPCHQAIALHAVQTTVPGMHPSPNTQDLADSKRINANIRSAARGAARGERAATVTATMLSALYWPQGSVPAPDEADLRLPPDVGSWLEEYGQAYHALKAPRKLQWCPSQGVVQLEVTVGDQALELTVSSCGSRGLVCGGGVVQDWCAWIMPSRNPGLGWHCMCLSAGTKDGLGCGKSSWISRFEYSWCTDCVIWR